MNDDRLSRRPRILLLEPNEAVALTISAVLGDLGAEIQRAGTAAQARAILEHFRPDLVVLELLLPDADGLSVLVSLVSRTRVPVFVCSTASSVRERVLCLKQGAEDFVAKPFDIDELAVRVQAVLRRVRSQSASSSEPPPAPLQQQADDLVLDPSMFRVTIGGCVVHLTPPQYRILAVLMSRPNKVVTREELARAVGEPLHLRGSRALDMQVRRLRARLAAYPGRAPAIVSVRGLGYRLIASPRRESPAA